MESTLVPTLPQDVMLPTAMRVHTVDRVGTMTAPPASSASKEQRKRKSAQLEHTSQI